MTIILYIRNLFFRLFNALLGKTGLFIAILAWFLIITGTVFLFRPQRARNKLAGMSFQPFKWVLLITCVYLGGGLLSLSGKIGGLISFIIMIAIIISALKFYFIFKKKLFNKFIVWFSTVPMKHLRVFAIIQITVGCLMLALKKRIWF